MPRKLRLGFAGYTEYRYGPKPGIRIARRQKPRHIIDGDRREFVISRLAEWFREARPTRFRFEGPSRNGIRQHLVLAGYSWETSDLEAAGLVSAALAAIGARRPTWEQGQPEYTFGPDMCAQCGGPMDEAGLTSGKRYCSTECAAIAYARFDRSAVLESESAEKRARYLFKRELNPTRECAHCRQAFRPAVDGARYCSAICSRLTRDDLVPDRQCDHCGKTYHPPTVTAPSRFCSRDCQAAAARKIQPRACSVCGTAFTPKRDSQTACSRACSRKEPGKHPERPCDQCGSVFRPKTPWGRYCSATCRNKAGHEREKAKPSLAPV